MQNKKTMNIVMALSALALIGGGIIAVQAAENNVFEKKAARGNGEMFGNGEKRGFENLSEEEKIAMEAERESHRAEMEANREAAEAAIASNDYNAWKEAVGANNPFVEKVTAENFSQFVEAHNLMEQARKILAEIGIDDAPGNGFAKGHGRGLGQGFGNLAK